MIKTSKHILKYSNQNKLDFLEQLFNDYQSDLSLYINLILSKNLPLKTNLTSKDIQANKISHSQWKQIIYKQASEIIRSNLKKTKNKCYNRYKKLYAKCKKENRHQKFLNKKYKELNINYLKRIKIDLKNVSLNIDNRLFDIQNGNSFDEFVMIRLPYFQQGKKRAIQLKLPIKHHKHSNKFKTWNRKNTIQIKRHVDGFMLSFFWEKDETHKRASGKDLGIDIGYRKLISDSNGKHYGSNLFDIYNKLANKVRGSKNYKDLLKHKTNEIRRVCNNLPLKGLQNLIIEDLKNVKSNSKIGHKTMNKMQYWSYRKVISKLEALSEIEGFNLIKVKPAYTSQECSSCGTIDKSSRKGEIYHCNSCGMKIDADTNGAINILRRGVYNPSSKEKQIL